MKLFRNTGIFMKPFVLTVSILFLSLSCSKDDKEDASWIYTEPSSVLLEANGAAQRIVILSNQYTQYYEVINGETTAKWVKVLRQNEFMSISADPNYSTKPRQEAKIQLRAGADRNIAEFYITVNQKAKTVYMQNLTGWWKIGDNILTMQDGDASLLVPNTIPSHLDEYIKDPEYEFDYSYDNNTNSILFKHGITTLHTLPVEYLSDDRMDIGGGNDFTGSYSRTSSDGILVSTPLGNVYFNNKWSVEGEDFIYMFYSDGTGNILEPVDIYNNIFTVIDGFSYSYNWKTNDFEILIYGEGTPKEYIIQEYSEERLVLNSKIESGTPIIFNIYTDDIQIEEP